MSKSLGNVLDPHVGDRALRRRRAALLLLPRGDVRLATARCPPRGSDPLRDRAGQRAGQPRLAHTLHGRGATGTASCPRSSRTAELAGDFDGLAERVAELLDGAQLTPALDEIWQRVRRLNRYVEERAPWQLAPRTRARPGELDVALRSLAEGLRVVAVLLHAYMPASTGRLLAALGQPDTLARRRPLRRRRRAGASVQALEPLFPKRRWLRAGHGINHPMIDSHAHLDHCSRGDADLIADAERAGVRPGAGDRDGRRVVPRRAGRGRGLPAGPRGDRPPSQQRDRLRRRRPGRARGAGRARALRRDRGDRASTTTATTRRATDQVRAFVAQMELARRDRQGRW